MKYIIDLKIGDKVWEVNGLLIYEKKVTKLSEEEVQITGRGIYKIDADTSNTSDRIVGYNTLCLTLEDACIVAKVNAFEKIKQHIKTIKETGSAIDAIGLRIDELNNLQYE